MEREVACNNLPKAWCILNSKCNRNNNKWEDNRMHSLCSQMACRWAMQMEQVWWETGTMLKDATIKWEEAFNRSLGTWMQWAIHKWDSSQWTRIKWMVHLVSQGNKELFWDSKCKCNRCPWVKCNSLGELVLKLLMEEAVWETLTRTTIWAWPTWQTWAW